MHIPTPTHKLSSIQKYLTTTTCNINKLFPHTLFNTIIRGLTLMFDVDRWDNVSRDNAESLSLKMGK